MAVIDLRSDTATRPTPQMRRVIAEAEVGDEQLREDPAVLALEDRVAELLGKEAAVFLPSGTLANIIALFVQCAAGDEVVLHRLSHPVYAENAGPAVHSRVSLTQLDGDDGIFTGDDVAVAVRPSGIQRQRTRLVAVENTNNRGGGSVWPLEKLDAVSAVARSYGLSTHLDGARLLNASVATGVPCARMAAGFETAWIDLSKGLGCPAGAVLAGADTFVEEARWAKHLFGGALRQAGILAAAGLYALDHHVERMADDHVRAAHLARELTALPGVELAQSRVDTNIVQLDVRGTGLRADELVHRLADDDVLVGTISRDVLRLVTHLDIADADITRVLEAVARAIPTP